MNIVVAHKQKEMVYFSALDFNITYTYSASATVPFDYENVCVCSFSNTYCNNKLFLFFFFCSESVPKWLGVGGANNQFSMMFSIQNTESFP